MYNCYGMELVHYGTPRHSGRYPYGSGENPYQGSGASYKSKRQLKKEEKAIKKELKNKKKEEIRKTKEDIKNIKLLSSEDLQTKLNRLKLEKEYKTLAKESVTSEGKKMVTDVMKSVGKTALTGVALYGVSKVGEGVYNLATKKQRTEKYNRILETASPEKKAEFLFNQDMSTYKSYAKQADTIFEFISNAGPKKKK